jgi:hypothetical protein
MGENEKLLTQDGFPGQDLLHKGRFIQGRGPFSLEQGVHDFLPEKIMVAQSSSYG